MEFFKAISPIRAYRDLRTYMRRRQPHEIVFLAASIGLTFIIVFAFNIEMKGAPPQYHREIIYFQQWRTDRTDAQIKAQQKIDGVEQTKREQAEKRAEAERRAAFKRLGDQMKAVGL